ncbi:patatin-like phospholipase family protein [Marinimicrobium alkaliphilum]|uniref:patatin-like phospholipase family protein n=1 Tax=Marinimicrobium alkaliphilum TaxID=2202654 RepID=UPI000DB99E2A|nr:patatin-like phospholipase family protein [Marinimicrobium alkaliphilum]
MLRHLITTFALFLALAIPAAAEDNTPATATDIALALGSGGAGGLSHIAMLGVFDELKQKPAHISGTSVGAVIGALYAAGLSAKEIEAVFKEFNGDGFDVLQGIWDSGLSIGNLLKTSINEGGLLDASNFLDYLAEQVEAERFEDLQIPLSIVATDYWTGEAVVIEEGDLFEAIAASMAVPGLFKPVTRGDQVLLDGGLANPLPYQLLMGRYDHVIAIDVSGVRERSEEAAGLTQYLFKTFEIMQQSIIRQMRQQDEPDLYLKPDTGDIQLLHFNRLNDILEKAQPEAEKLREFLRSH